MTEPSSEKKKKKVFNSNDAFIHQNSIILFSKYEAATPYSLSSNQLLLKFILDICQ